ncbi:MAG: 4Fe-4S dicluster domain-containing protein [Candidatus Bathyarchaeia archaeon]
MSVVGSMNTFIADLYDLDRLVEVAKSRYSVYAPVRRGRGYVFSKIEGMSDTDLGYNRTILPPTKIFHRPKEVLLRFQLADGPEFGEVVEVEPMMIFGVHACDLNAILRLDRFFTRRFEDPYYLARRKGSVVVALNCNGPRDEYCFCASLGTGPTVYGGYDILLTEVRDRMFLVEAGSEIGANLIDEARFRRASMSDMEAKKTVASTAKRGFRRYADFRSLSYPVIEVLAHTVWDEEADKCLSCGNCSLVCPTCYCYEIYDTLDMDLKSGFRVRRLDSCQLYGYAEVALGGNFRKSRKARLRHWMVCKFGGAAGGELSSCVGCGRCIFYCPARIDITSVASRLMEAV